MLWEVGNDDITPVQAHTYQGTLVGSVTVYKLGGKTYIETTELVGIPGCPNPLMEKRFREQALEDVLLRAGVDILPFKLRTLKQKGQDVRVNRKAKADEEPKKPFQPFTTFEPTKKGNE